MSRAVLAMLASTACGRVDFKPDGVDCDVIDGFETDEIEFGTDYDLLPGDCNLEGSFALVTRGTDCHESFDRDGVVGRFMAINGSVVASDIVWERSAPDLTDAILWRLLVRRMVSAAPAELELIVGDEVVGASVVEDGDWQQLVIPLTQASASARLAIRNRTIAASGNDLGIDEISICRP